MKRYRFIVLALLTGCAGFERSCASGCASDFGADWIIVQQKITDGEPYNCWQLRSTSVSNEQASDGVYWLDSSTGHLVHIAGQYARVQVKGGDFKSAAKEIGVDIDRCVGGRYGASK